MSRLGEGAAIIRVGCCCWFPREWNPDGTANHAGHSHHCKQHGVSDRREWAAASDGRVPAICGGVRKQEVRRQSATDRCPVSVCMNVSEC